MKDIQAVFDSSESSSGGKVAFVPTPEGVYPSHVSDFTVNDYKGSKVFNLSFTIADEASKLDVPKLVSDGNSGWMQDVDGSGKAVSAKADFMVGNAYRSDKGVWLTPNPAKGESWKNKRYKEYFENLRVSFPEGDDGTVSLAEVEREDVIGQPCLINLKQTSFTNKEGETRTAMKVVAVHNWKDGEVLSAEELSADVPF